VEEGSLAMNKTGFTEDMFTQAIDSKEDKNQFAPIVNGIKGEKTGERDLSYSLFRRTVGKNMYSVDIDMVEFRQDRGIVGFFAVTGRCNSEQHIINSKRFIWKRTKLERKILSTLSEAVDAPAFFVIHDNELSVFHVHNLSESLDKYISMDRDKYTEFIRSL